MLSEIVYASFFQRALIAGVLVAFVAGLLGVFVIQKRLSFLAGGLAHAAFGGVALGILLQQEPLLTAIPFTILTAIAIRWVEERSPVTPDTAIGIFFALSMALGIIFLSKSNTFAVDATQYLFGSILLVSQSDVYASVLLFFSSLLVLFSWSRWGYAALDSELAEADGVNVRFDDYLIYVSVALIVVLSIRIVGVVLIGAFAVVPAASARLMSRRLITMTFLAVALSVFSVVAGLFLSVVLDLPSGAVIILLEVAIFLVALAIHRKM